MFSKYSDGVSGSFPTRLPTDIDLGFPTLSAEVSLRPGRMTLAVHFVLAAEGGATAQEQAALGAFLTGYIGAQVQRVSMLGSSRREGLWLGVGRI